MRAVTEEEKCAAGVGAVEIPVHNKENIPHERIFPDSAAHTEDNFVEETITRPALPVVSTLPNPPSYSDKNALVFEPSVSTEATMRPM
ncbi:unnamed protein product [Dibothriocephalus latus]|uniref:Uncharacterized protein n=1 Tax=Dibothriocephalus latus TaxID=60516 RepID=A0A3P7LBP5_DIBLA|nr:unnamed protein product [Dibothriocephalus latus]